MRKQLILAAGAIFLAVAASAQTPPPTISTVANKVEWDQAAPDLATAQSLAYRHYDDNAAVGLVFPAVVCVGSVSPFVCSAPLPAFVTGAHSMQLTAAVTVAGSTVESAKSLPVAFTFVVVPSVPGAPRIK